VSQILQRWYILCGDFLARKERPRNVVKTNGFTSTEIETLLETKSTGKWVKIEEEIAKIWLPEFEKEAKQPGIGIQ